MAFDAFLKIGGDPSVPGECTDDKHKEWVEVLSYSFGISQPTSGSASTGGGRSAERCNHSGFSWMKTLDKTSATLALFCCNGTHISECKLELCRATGDKQLYYEVTMEDLMVSRYQPTGSSGGDVPVEAVGFDYGKVTWNYTETDHETGKPGSSFMAWWNLVNNTGGS